MRKKDIFLIRLRFQGCRCESGMLSFASKITENNAHSPFNIYFLEGSTGHILASGSWEFFIEFTAKSMIPRLSLYVSEIEPVILSNLST